MGLIDALCPKCSNICSWDTCALDPATGFLCDYCRKWEKTKPYFDMEAFIKVQFAKLYNDQIMSEVING